MSAKWYLTRDGRTNFGPYDDAQLRDFAASGRIAPTDMIWQEGTNQWVPATSVPGLVVAPPAPPPPPPIPQAGVPQDSAGGSKIAAGICAIFLGCFGIHKFILGLTMPGVVLLLVTLLTCGWGQL